MFFVFPLELNQLLDLVNLVYMLNRALAQMLTLLEVTCGTHQTNNAAPLSTVNLQLLLNGLH